MKRWLCRLFGHRWSPFVETRRNRSGLGSNVDAVVKCRACRRCGANDIWRTFEIVA